MFRKHTPKVITDKAKIDELLTRGVEDIIIRESLEKKLLAGKELRVKLGFDPTGSKIHIGRAIVLRKLKAFQDLGHKVVFLVGDFTAQIGDPSDKLEKRPMLSKEKIAENLKDYKNQVGKIIDLSKAEFHFNSKWLSKLSFEETCKLAEAFSVQQMLARRNFKDRFDQGQEISLREFMYPLMQGYDSVALKADIEIGGFDQLFNLKAGRIVQKYYNMPEQDILTTQMLEGTDGRKMSTSWGNVVNIVDDPNDMFGKIMSVKDELIVKYFTLCTDLPLNVINEYGRELEAGKVNPRDVKLKLAHEIVKMYHSEALAEKAHANFIETFSKKGIPDDIEEVVVEPEASLVDLLLESKIVASKTEFRRLITEGAIKNTENDEKITSPDYVIAHNITLKVGKRRFIKIKIK